MSRYVTSDTSATRGVASCTSSLGSPSMVAVEQGNYDDVVASVTSTPGPVDKGSLTEPVQPLHRSADVCAPDPHAKAATATVNGKASGLPPPAMLQAGAIEHQDLEPAHSHTHSHTHTRQAAAARYDSGCTCVCVCLRVCGNVGEDDVKKRFCVVPSCNIEVEHSRIRYCVMVGSCAWRRCVSPFPFDSVPPAREACSYPGLVAPVRWRLRGRVLHRTPQRLNPL